MTNKVLYLCRSSKAKRGWVFPDEEEDCDFPGGFFIEEQAGKLQDSYLLEAISQEKLVTLSLQKKERHIFLSVLQQENSSFFAPAAPKTRI